jgi:hypothetical protein
MEFEMTFGCKYHADNNCFEWDYLANLYLCDDADSTQCGTEIGRWITAYRREGKWVSDATPFLAYLRSGGTKRFRFVTSDRWIVSMNIRLFRTGSGLTATEVIPLWTGGQFNLTYNPSKLPVTVSIDPTVKKAQLVALISGHGFGADVENCCEFCNHTHHFFVNGREYVKSYPEAGTQLGCLQQVPDGVSPDQYGTWYFGRGGWCPGYVVRPFIVDVTDALAQGENTLTYKALYRGQEYNPVPAPGGGTFWGRIDLSSYLVLWRSAQTSASGAQEPDAIDLAQNYPNPFRAATNISYTLPAAQRATVAVYDMLGRRVAVPFDGLDTPGTHDVQFRRGDLPPGLYLYRLSAGGTTRSKTMSVVD